MTQPLTPKDCDLRDFAFMPLDVVRLRDSDMAATESPEACWAAVLLWAASWHQVPAASLPDDDRVLSNLAGYGRVVREWLKVKSGAMRGWIKCDDGRLYHPVVAEKANESWESKLRHAYGKMCDRTRKLNKALEEKKLPSVQVPVYDQWIATGKDDPKPTEILSPSAGIPPDNPLKGQGQGQGQGQGEREKGGAPQAPSPTPPPSRKREQTTLTTYLEACKAAKTKPVPKEHAIHHWCADAGITTEMIQVAWLVFRERYTEDEKGKGKRYKDWPAHFANAIKNGWFKLWYVSEDGQVSWTSIGLTRKSVLDARMTKREVSHASA